MKKILKYILIPALILGVISIALIINILFKFDFNIWWLESEWTAGEALAFFGTIISSILGIAGVILTINMTQKNYREDIIRQSLPFFSINFLIKQTSVLDIWEQKDKIDIKNGNDYKEFRLRKVFFILKPKKIDAVLDLNKKQMELLKHNGDDKSIGPHGEIIISHTTLLSQAIEFENVGKGAAINVRIGLNKVGTLESEKEFLNPVNLKQGEFFYINIFAENVTKDIIGKYIIEIEYSDIYNNSYAQRYKLDIKFKTEHQSGYLIEFDYKTVQEHIKGK